MGWYDRLEAATGAGDMRAAREREAAEAARRDAYPGNLGGLLSSFDLQGLSQRWNLDKPISYADDDTLDKYLVDAVRTGGNALGAGVVEIGSGISGAGNYLADKTLGSDSAFASSLDSVSKSLDDFQKKNFDYHAVGDSTADKVANFAGDLVTSVPLSIAMGLTGAGASGRRGIEGRESVRKRCKGTQCRGAVQRREGA